MMSSRKNTPPRSGRGLNNIFVQPPNHLRPSTSARAPDMDEVEDLGLLSIGLADSDDSSGSDEGVIESRVDRSRQSEAEFQQLKSEYRVKVENGEVRMFSIYLLLFYFLSLLLHLRHPYRRPLAHIHGSRLH